MPLRKTPENCSLSMENMAVLAVATSLSGNCVQLQLWSSPPATLKSRGCTAVLKILSYCNTPVQPK